MADCASLPNAAELVEKLRSNPNNVWMTEAADAIEQLLSKTEQLESQIEKLKADVSFWKSLYEMSVKE